MTFSGSKRPGRLRRHTLRRRTSSTARCRDEFAAARGCARAALARLHDSWGQVAIPRQDDGAPQWPQGVVGSISHCTGLRVAAVAFDAHVAALGIDVELARPLPPEVADYVLDSSERRLLAAAGAVDTVGFSLKEALFKARWPQTRQWLDFTDARLESVADGVAYLRLRHTHEAWAHHLLRLRWNVDDTFVRTAAWIPAHLGGSSATSNRIRPCDLEVGGNPS